MSDAIATPFQRFVDAERAATRLPAIRARIATGEIADPIMVSVRAVGGLFRAAAAQSLGLSAEDTAAEVVWVDGDRELAVNLGHLRVQLEDGLIRVVISVRCDEIDTADVEVAFAVGSHDAPAGLYASAFRRPNGPPLIVSVWGDALIAFAWGALLGFLTGVAGAAGRDDLGSVLVPVELIASAKGIEILPMARHRFDGDPDDGRGVMSSR